MKGIILAGGLGERLRPMTGDRPKPLVEFMTQRVLDGVVKMLIKNGVDRATVSGMYMCDAIADYASSCPFMKISCVKEEVPLGTAGAVRGCAEGEGETFAVVSGDCITDIDLTEAIRLHRSVRAEATMVLIEADDPTAFGCVCTDPDGRVTGYIEKPPWSGVNSGWCNAGIYILEPSALRFIPKDRPSDFSMDIFPKMLEEGVLYACRAKGYWCDIGDEGKYRQAHFDMLDGKCSIFKPGMGKNVQIGENVRIIPPVYIGDNTVIEGGSVIGSHTVIGEGCTISSSCVEGSVIWKGVSMEACRVMHSVICDDVRILHGASIGVGCVVASRCTVGRFARLESGCRLWSGTVVDDETRVTGDCTVPHNVRRAGAADMRYIHYGELLPERMMLLARAFGQGRRITLSFDGSGMALGALHVLAGGISMAGGSAIMCGEGGMGQTSFSVKHCGADGGIYISSDRNGISFILLDAQGLELSPREMGGVSKKMISSEFIASEGSVSQRDLRKEYYMHLLDHVGVRAQGRSVAILGDETAAGHLARVLSHLGWVAIIPKEDVKSTIKSNACVFGIRVNKRFGVDCLYDQNGSKVSYEQFIALRARLCLEAGAKEAVIPCDCSDACLEVIKKYGTVQKCRLNTASEVARQTEVVARDIITDAACFCLSLLKLLCGKRGYLSENLEELPLSVVSAARCPARMKGRVMNKIREKDLKVTVIPDDSLAVLKVYANALSQEYARELALDATAVINEIVMHGQS